MEKVTLKCACGCGAQMQSDTRVENEPGGAKVLKPLQVHPYITLDCWLAGWRHDGPQADGTYRIFNVGRQGAP